MFTEKELREFIKNNRTDIFYNSHYWRKLSAEVKKENKNECLICKSKGRYKKAVIVHHVFHLKKYPEYAYCKYIEVDGKQIMQLMPLCIECHNEIHGKYSSASNSFTNDEKW